MQLLLPFWQRLLATVVVMVAASYIVGLVWEWVLGFPLPSFLGGLVGGLAALPFWSFLKRIRPSQA